MKCRGITRGMKAAVSIPNEIFERAERYARQIKKSRSQLVSAALDEYLARHAPDEVTEAMNRVCEEVGDTKDPFSALAARRILRQSQW